MSSFTFKKAGGHRSVLHLFGPAGVSATDDLGRRSCQNLESKAVGFSGAGRGIAALMRPRVSLT